MLRARSTASELMDDAQQGEAAIRADLADIERLNRWSRAYAPTLGWLDALARRRGARKLSVLDIGAGSGDMLRRIAAWGGKCDVALELTGLDRCPWTARIAAEAGTPATWITADLFDLPEDARFDAVICSQFAHHLADDELVRFLRLLQARSRLGWLISDLHRHWMPWTVAWAGVRLARLDPMVVHDATISIARGFSRDDLRRLAREAGVSAQIRWVFPFRWLVSSEASV